VTESVSLQKRKKIDDERESKSMETENENIEKEISIKSEDVDIKMEEVKNELNDIKNIKNEIIDAMDVDPVGEVKTENEKSTKDTETDSKTDTKDKENNSDDIMNDNTRKVMFHNIMDNSHVPLEDDMEFELYMYKFLCMQFGIENVTSENMSLPIMLDYFGSEGVTYNMYDNETSKLTLGVDNNDVKKKVDKNEKTEVKSSDKKLWKVHIDNYCCTIDRKTLVSDIFIIKI